MVVLALARAPAAWVVAAAAQRTAGIAVRALQRGRRPRRRQSQPNSSQNSSKSQTPRLSLSSPSSHKPLWHELLRFPTTDSVIAAAIPGPYHALPMATPCRDLVPLVSREHAPETPISLCHEGRGSHDLHHCW
ncbi:hypothetical protein M758_UG213100 [Ceratodon purpureus]|nr:hypothetical protein M758_UG213100 [Ceratodon purpureus]